MLGYLYGLIIVVDVFVLGGMYVNDVVLLGCLGIDLVYSVVSFYLDGGWVYVGVVFMDLISMFG